MKSFAWQRTLRQKGKLQNRNKIFTDYASDKMIIFKIYKIYQQTWVS